MIYRLTLKTLSAIALFTTLLLVLVASAQVPVADERTVKPSGASAYPRVPTQGLGKESHALPNLTATKRDTPGLMGPSAPFFLPEVTYSTDGNDGFYYGENWVTIADVNGDGKPDLLVANWCVSFNGCPTKNGSVGVLLGNGDGTFQAASTYDSGGYFGFSIIAADVNADGKPDLLVLNGCANLQSINCPTQGSVGVLLGNGDGTFQTVRNYVIGEASSIALGDLNGDGKPDIVVANRVGGSNGDGSVAVLLGKGDGTFQPLVAYDSAGSQSVEVVIADLNSDGKPDLLVVNDSGPLVCGGCHGNVAVLLGKGDGTFQSAVAYSGAFFPDFVVAADLNGDGKPDLVMTTGSSGGGLLAVLLGNGDGTFQTAALYGTGLYATPVTVVDLDRDGNVDIVVGNGYCPAGSGDCVGVLMGNGDGTFRAQSTYPCGGSGGCDAIAVTDLNGDGKLDLVVSSALAQDRIRVPTSPVGVLFGNGDGTFQPVATYGLGGIGSTWIGLADVNGDGKPDVVVANPQTTTGSLGVLINNTARPYNSTSTNLRSSLNPAQPTQMVTYTAAVTSDRGGTATGTMTFTDGVKTVGSVAMAGNSASFSTSYAARLAGEHAIVASYSGDANNGFSSSGILTEVVKSTTKMVVTTSGSPSHLGDSVTFTATVTPKVGAVPDGELVTFSDGAAVLASVALNSGVAVYTTSSLSARTHGIKAAYPGDALLDPSKGSVKQVVEP